MKAFADGEDIYCASASQIFGVPVKKNGINGHLRQKGKVAELACIAEGQLVLTNHGLIPIENVSVDDLLWDGEKWVETLPVEKRKPKHTADLNLHGDGPINKK